MSGDWLLVVHLCYEPGEKPPAQEVLDWLFQRGAHTEKDGGNETCNYFAADHMGMPSVDAPTDRAIDQLQTSEGYLELWLGDVEFYYQNWDDYVGVPDLPYYTLKFPAGQLNLSDRATQIVDIVGDFADETAPVYAFGHEGAGDHESHRQDAQRLLDGQLEKLFWFNYLSKPFVQTIGRERLLSAPAERVEERAHGAILLVPYVIHRKTASREQADNLSSVKEYLGLRH